MRGQIKEVLHGPVQGDGDRHPRPARGADHGRPHRHHARRPDRAGRLRRTRSSPSPPTCSSPSFIGTPQMNLVEAELAEARRTARPRSPFGRPATAGSRSTRRVARAGSRRQGDARRAPARLEPSPKRVGRRPSGDGRADRADGRRDAGPLRDGTARHARGACRAQIRVSPASAASAPATRARPTSSTRREGRCDHERRGTTRPPACRRAAAATVEIRDHRPLRRSRWSLIFQPFSLLLFSIGCGLVVFGGAGLQPGAVC